VTGLQFTVDAALAPHLDAALTTHLRRLREAGIRAPVDIIELAEWARLVTSGLSSPPPVLLVDDAPMAQLLSFPAAAAELGCGVSKVKKLVAAGALPTVDFDGVRRIRRADLDAFMAGLPPSPPPSSFRDRIVTKDAAPRRKPGGQRARVATRAATLGPKNGAQP
jgi:excisionase family DNA binding protein